MNKPININQKNFLQTIFWLLVMLILPGNANAQLKPITDFDYHNIGKQLSYFEDRSAKLDLTAIERKYSEGKFISGKQQILNFGNTTSAWWLKISFLSKAQMPLYLIVDAPNIEHIESYSKDEKGNLIRLTTGSLMPSTAQVAVGNNFVMPLPIYQKEQVRTVYQRLQTNNILLAPIKLGTAEKIMKGRTVKIGIEYIYIGLLIGLLLFNLFLFVSIKDITYLYYVLYVLTLSSYLLVYIRGYGFMFGEDLRIIFNYRPHVFLSLSVVTSLIFCSRFLNLQKNAKSMVNVFYFVGICGIVLFLVSMFGYKHLATSIAQLLTVSVSLVVWIAGIIAYRNGHKPAKYYIVAWFFIWVTVGIVTMSLGGIIEPSELTIQLVPIGSTIELLLLSFALGDRYKVIIENEQLARDENLQLIRTQNQRLEENVQERTLLLSNTIKELQQSNTVKNKLFSIIAHDLRSPMNSLMSILSLNDMHALNIDELRTLLKKNKDNIDTITNTLNNLLHWAQGQMNGIVANTSNFDIKMLLDELILVYEPLIKNKEISLSNESVSAIVFADQDQIMLVLRNLIDNAIKFTPVNGTISLKIKKEQQEVEVSIENEVENPEHVQLDNMLGLHIATATPGTQNEKGVGLGLHLCREYIKSNGGNLNTTLKDKIVSFCFTLPALEV